MHIVIVGGGDLGRHVASILSKEKQSVILIESDSQVIQSFSGLDIATRHGSGTDWQLLDDLLEFSPDLLIALTGDDDTNLVSCSIAKQLSYPRTIARVRDSRYTNPTRLDFGRIFDVDFFVGPELLVAHDMLKRLLYPESLNVENFAHGALQLRTLLIPMGWRGQAEPLRSFRLPQHVIVSLIKRREGGTVKIIFPHGDDSIQPGDEVTFIGVTDVIAEIHELFDIREKAVQSVVIAGGSLTGMHLAQLLAQRNIDVRLIEKDYERCRLLAEKLPNYTIMHHDATDLDFFHAEKIGQADVFVACTNNDEINILAALLGKEVGCDNTLIVLNNTSYIPIVERLGLQHTISPQTSATNHILSQLYSGKISTLISLYENQAEVMEITVSPHSKIVGIPLAELGPYLPKDLLIIMIQNRGRIMIANGNRVISPGDTVIVVSSPKHVDELGKIF
ncbi:MAG: Trk system potassium transporter TrkA [Parachlamydiaceae bacterium]|nr:Trk system potassium transporter TrkA [Parachlamydiaceae bacterium]